MNLTNFTEYAIKGANNPDCALWLGLSVGQIMGVAFFIKIALYVSLIWFSLKILFEKLINPLITLLFSKIKKGVKRK